MYKNTCIQKDMYKMYVYMYFIVQIQNGMRRRIVLGYRNLYETVIIT